MACGCGWLRVTGGGESKIMSITELAFLRSVSLIRQQGELQKKVGRVCFIQPERQVEIQYQTMPELKLGAMNLPQLQLLFNFECYSHTQRSEFIQQFEKVFRRGGG